MGKDWRAGHRSAQVTGYKNCTRCTRWRPISDFHHRGWLADGTVSYIQPDCGACHRLATKKHYHRMKLKRFWLEKRRRQEKRARDTRLGLVVDRGARRAPVVVLTEEQKQARRRPVRPALWWEVLDEHQLTLAMRFGVLSLFDCAAWASLYPDEVPVLNGEFEYIARTLE